jgi:hypothetical protein
MRRLLPVVVFLLLAVVPGSAAHVLQGSRLTVTLADPAIGVSSDSDRLDAVTWLDPSGTPQSGYVANGGRVCGDDTEFFGQSYGEPEGTRPYAIVAATVSKWTQRNPLGGKAKVRAVGNCFGPPDVLATTAYKVFTTASGANELRVARTFAFDASTPHFAAHGLRSYVPRVPLFSYPNVIWPNAAGTTLLMQSAFGCQADCEETDWNGRWFADDDGHGTGLMVIRDAASTPGPVLLTINEDTASGSNLASVVLVQPAAGWHTPVTEIEHLCFYDPTTWPAPARAAGQLPSGCAA